MCSDAFGSPGKGHCLNPGNNYVRETEPLSPGLNKELSMCQTSSSDTKLTPLGAQKVSISFLPYIAVVIKERTLRIN